MRQAVLIACLLICLFSRVTKAVESRRTMTPTTTSNSTNATESHIYYGTDVPSNAKYPWMASLRDLAGNHFCGATLISERVLLSAAHCFYDAETGLKNTNIRKVYATIGKRKLSDPATQYFITKIVYPRDKIGEGSFGGYYEDGTYDYYGDIALLVLDRPCYKRPIQLRSPFQDISSIYTLTAIGWGDDEKSNSPNVLQETQIPTTSASKCKKAIGYVEEDHVCLGISSVLSTLPKTCFGDSGGPNFIPAYLQDIDGFNDDYLVGITSYVRYKGKDDGTCHNTVPVVTRINFWYDWIFDMASLYNMRGDAPPQWLNVPEFSWCLWGTIDDDFYARTIDDCASACVLSDACLAWTWFSDNAYCFLFTDDWFYDHRDSICTSGWLYDSENP